MTGVIVVGSTMVISLSLDMRAKSSEVSSTAQDTDGSHDSVCPDGDEPVRNSELSVLPAPRKSCSINQHLLDAKHGSRHQEYDQG